ncbi:HET domain-containing protein [Colletotrichum higginsianum]|uniref:HET domain-containing protein n=2 Tax=Colletotrichum higginsianum TaxID=80884 RepID=H1VE68_COLHI|nr:HET domain-containing protein [Colletotrichum higginsianum IMI 349063]OBR07209.1 HET domain-containing protein [Colletotrichum higginsianum IMI 349063]TIC92320.1 Vegetative incompatibility protein HET-E-1 [Colletotrichum higginsianum]CCF38521.1 HET domain-containing protein [Colletotrichum higginsianum]
MWLISTETSKLHAFIPPDVPPYAILSHTWEAGEVTFQEFADLDAAREKPGFAKIDKTCELARQNGLEWVWVDTCCIDKSSSAELSEAINSMFEWYRLSAVCFAYLADLPVGSPSLWMFESESGIHKRPCRWFQRGWTLQELIAPSRLEFFDVGWNSRGFKTDGTVLRQLSSMAGIRGKTARVLKNSDAIGEISIAERMSWASKRQTTRTEDMAYCLLGIFRVNMPLLYGEGPRAFIRLQEEILKNSTDMSLFCWTASEETIQPYRGLLARHPSEFASWFDTELTSRKSISWAMCEQEKEFSSTNKGIRMEATLASFFYDGEERTCLRCTLFPDEYVVFVALRYHRDNIYVRELPKVIIPSRTTRYEQKTIYIAKDVDERMSTSLQETAAEALSFDTSLLPASFSLEVAECWPKKQWHPRRKEFALTGSKLFSCTVVYTVAFDGVQIGEVFLICQRHASALQPLRYALIPSRHAAGIKKGILDHETGDDQGNPPFEAFSMMEQFIIDGRQEVKLWHGETCFSLFVTRYSETGESTNQLFLKATSSDDLLHPMPVRLPIQRSIGDGNEPDQRLERAPQIGGDVGVLVVQQPNPMDILEAERENTG